MCRRKHGAKARKPLSAGGTGVVSCLISDILPSSYASEAISQAMFDPKRSRARKSCVSAKYWPGQEI
jgi:hypothetical protein